MIALVVILTAVAVVLAVVAVAELVPARERAVARKLEELEQIVSQRSVTQRRRRQEKSDRLEVWLENLGERVSSGRSDLVEVRQKVVRAGFRQPQAASVYYALRIVAAAGGVFGVLVAAPALGVSGTSFLVWLGAGAAIGWMLPSFLLGRRIKRRQKEIQKALPDALDMLVVCVEAGLGLNQAMVRVSDEIETISPVMSEELQIVNLEIRAGKPREEALRNLGLRTDVADVRALATMLIQTDRFGTSVAQALRVHSDGLRTKRRQRAEEAAAKTTIKMVIPLVLFVFPALFVVILGPAVMHILRELGAAI
jgi:tight adherence protein C